MFNLLSQLKKSRFTGHLTRHGIVLAMLLLVGTGAIGGTIFGAFAYSPCRSGDITYRVGWGNTLSGIAAHYGTSYWTLARYNHIANPNYIYVGQAICIPSRSSSPISSSGGSNAPVSVMPQSGYMGVAQQAANTYGISAYYFVRQINQESGFNPYARSWAGAIGIAQFMPGTAAALGINPYNPVQSLYGAARLMASYYHQYGSYAMALAAYNAGPGNVQYAVVAGGGNWMAFLPAETRSYIYVIMY